MVIESVNICLGHHDRIYYPGELLSGYCEVVVTGERSDLSSVALKLQGIAKVTWSESLTKKNNLGHIHTVWYIDSVIVLAKKAEISIQNESLDPGRHNLPFAFQLRPNLPSTFDGSYGKIRYWLEATATSPDFTTKAFASFKILQPIDVSCRHHSVEDSVSKVIRRCFCVEGILAMRMKADRDVYCSGDSVNLSGNFENSSKRKAKIFVKLVQSQAISTRDGQTKVHATSIPLSTDDDSRPVVVKKQSCLIWNEKSFRLPLDVAPSSTCSVLQVSYHLEVGVTIPNKSATLNVKLPIVLGSLPIRKYFAQSSMIGKKSTPLTTCQDDELKSGDLLRECSSTGSTAMEPPPSYHETMLAISSHFSDNDA